MQSSTLWKDGGKKSFASVLDILMSPFNLGKFILTKLICDSLGAVFPVAYQIRPL